MPTPATSVRCSSRRIGRAFHTLRLGAHLLVLLLIAAPAHAASGSAEDRIDVVIVVHDQLRKKPSSEERAAWISRIESALRDARIQVLDRSALGATSGELAASEPTLRRSAKARGADVVLFARIGRLGERVAVDLRVLPVSTDDSLLRRVLSVEHPDQMLQILGDSAALARSALLQWEPRAQTPTEAETIHADAEGGAAGAAVAPSTGQRVLSVDVRGNRRIDADAVRAVVQTQPGASYSRAQLSQDVRRIYALGFFRDVQVLAEPSLDGVRVEFAVEENPIIRRVSVSGNDNVEGEDIREKLTLAVGATLDYPLVIENKQRIEAFYQSKGFYTANVRYVVESLGDAAVAIDYEVDEGELLRLREIVFEGNQAMDDGELMEGFQTKPWGLMSFVTRLWDNSGMYAEPVFYQDMQKVQRKYLDSGFIRARMSEPEVEMAEDGLRVRVEIQEGPQFRVGDVDVMGDDSMDREQLVSLLALKPGQVFNRSMLSDDVERLRMHYADLGYFQAKVKPRTEVDPKTLTVSCVLEAEKGELFFVERIDVAGNTRTRDDVVRRELSLVEGELYSDAALRRSRARLKRLGFFEEVTVESRASGEDRVAVEVGVVERPTGTFTFGAGFGTTDGFLLNGALRQDNLFGKGYALNLSADLGSRNQRAVVSFTDPFFRGTPAALTTGLNFSSIEFEDFEQSVSSLRLDVSYPLDEGETRVGTGYAYSDQDIESDFDRGVASLLQREQFGGRSSTSSVAFSGTVDTRDDPRLPRAGQNSGFTFEVAGLGGVSKFLRLEARTTRYMPFQLLGLDSTFVFNTRAGYALPLNSLSDFDLDDCSSDSCLAVLNGDPSLRELSDIDDDIELPLSERFILGGVGAFQVRGYETRSLGPRRARLAAIQAGDSILFRPLNQNPACQTDRASLPDDACNDFDDTDPDDFDDLDLTDVIGGNKMFLANFELRVPVAEDFGITGIWFFDMGNAFAEDESFDPSELRFGTGVGAEWLSPFGPLVVYLGVPINRLEDEKAAVFEFSVGGASF